MNYLETGLSGPNPIRQRPSDIFFLFETLKIDLYLYCIYAVVYSFSISLNNDFVMRKKMYSMVSASLLNHV